jgi:hypothetical protein
MSQESLVTEELIARQPPEEFEDDGQADDEGEQEPAGDYLSELQVTAMPTACSADDTGGAGGIGSDRSSTVPGAKPSRSLI